MFVCTVAFFSYTGMYMVYVYVLVIVSFIQPLKRKRASSRQEGTARIRFFIQAIFKVDKRVEKSVALAFSKIHCNTKTAGKQVVVCRILENRLQSVLHMRPSLQRNSFPIPYRVRYCGKNINRSFTQPGRLLVIVVRKIVVL